MSAGSTGAGHRPGIIEKYSQQLPVTESTPIVTLGEGDTPLIHSDRLSRETGVDVWLKHEGLNPTGSFKDRGMTVAVSKALEEGSRAVVCASTGNTSASAAAYAARAGIICAVIIPKGNVAIGKLAQAMAHGARILEVDGNFDEALVLTRELASNHPVALVNSVNPHRIEGQKTTAFEIVESLGGAPDVHVMPVGNAGNITAHWKGYCEAEGYGWSKSRPVMLGWQAEGASPIVRGSRVQEPKTIATAIRIGNPASWEGAVKAASESGGEIGAVTDREILDAYRLLASDGVFVELASAASVAGLRRAAGEGSLPERATVVCVLTGHGLKDPDWAISGAPQPKLVELEIRAVLSELNLA
jgi:threonine synthase